MGRNMDKPLLIMSCVVVALVAVFLTNWFDSLMPGVKGIGIIIYKIIGTAAIGGGLGWAFSFGLYVNKMS